MSFSRVYFDLSGPRWAKIRDQWWGDFLLLCLGAVIFGNYLYYAFVGLPHISRLWEWAAAFFGAAISVSILSRLVVSFLKSFRRYRRLLARRARLITDKHRNPAVQIH